jgi:hypothetical protein
MRKEILGHLHAVGDLVYIWNLEIARPEQVNWIGTILELFDDPNSGAFPKIKARVLWNYGGITEIWSQRLAPGEYRKLDKTYGGDYEISY